MKRIAVIIVTIGILAAIAVAVSPRSEPAPARAGDRVSTGGGVTPARYRYEVVNTFPHDREAFTQGLLYRDGFLYESTGCGRGGWDGTRCVGGPSSLRKVRLETGEVLQRVDVDAEYFAEGLADWRDSLVQLTWQSNVGFVYDLATFRSRRNFRYPGEGWGLTHDGRQLIMSDGTSTLRFLDPETLEESERLQVQERGLSVANLNELEMVRDEIFANVWQTNEIVVISPGTGHVTARIDFSGLQTRLDGSSPIDVLNGIAYDAVNDRLFVTGKLWPLLFEVRVVRE
jgi:glutaminyl-peptide cyclotransferase